MALPKQKQAKGKTRRRRAQSFNKLLRAPEITLCPRCYNYKRSHFVCPHCGFYRGTEVLRVQESKEES